MTPLQLIILADIVGKTMAVSGPTVGSITGYVHEPGQNMHYEPCNLLHELNALKSEGYIKYVQGMGFCGTLKGLVHIRKSAKRGDK